MADHEAGPEDDDATTILVVDDDVYVRMVLQLELEHIRILEAANIGEAREILSRETPDAAIVDRRLMGDDGLDLVAEMRQTITTVRLPIMVLTAGYDPADREEVIRAGADDYMGKPFEPAELLTRLRRLDAIPPVDRRKRRWAQAAAARDGRFIDDLEHEDRRAEIIDLTDEQLTADGTRRWWRRLIG